MKTKMSIIVILMSTLFLFAGCAGMAYKKATETNSIIAFRQFVSKYPDDKYAPEAKKKIEELYWQQKMNQNSISGYETYLQEYPEGKYAKEAEVKIEDMVWAEVQAAKNLKAYDLYLSKYPNGRFAAQASALAEENAWKDAIEKDQKEPYKAFIARFVTSAHLADAKQRLENVIWNNAEKAKTDIGFYRDYLDRYPGGLYAKEARDCVDWAKLEDIGTPASFKKYLSLHPKGRFVKRARVHLENKNKPAPKKIAQNINSTIDLFTYAYLSTQMKRYAGGTFLIKKENPSILKFGGDGKWSEIEVNENILPMQGAIHYWTSSTGTDVKNPKFFYVIDEGFKCQYEDNTYRYSNKKWYYDLGNETFFKSK